MLHGCLTSLKLFLRVTLEPGASSIPYRNDRSESYAAENTEVLQQRNPICYFRPVVRPPRIYYIEQPRSFATYSP